MDDLILRNSLRTIGLQNYFYAIKKLIKENPSSDAVLIQVLGLDYSNVQAKYSYFKKCYLDALNRGNPTLTSSSSQSPATILAQKLVDENIINSFSINSYIKAFTTRIEEYSIGLFIVSFDYTLQKMLQLQAMAKLEPTKKIHSPGAYFMSSLESNLEKVTTMFISDAESQTLLDKYKIDLKLF